MARPRPYGDGRGSRTSIEPMQGKLNEIPAPLDGQCRNDVSCSPIGTLRPQSLNKDEAQALQKVRILIEAGADPNLQSASGATPLLSAAIAGTTSVCDYLLSHGAQLDIASACLLGKFQEVKSILAEQPNLAIKNEIALHTPLLHWAIRSGDLKIVELILSQGADIDVRSPELGYQDAGGFTALTYVDSLGFTPLHLAASLGHVPMVKLLLDRGANIELKAGESDELESVLDIAWQLNQWEIARFLLDMGQTLDPKEFNPANVLSHVDDISLMWRVLDSMDDFDFQSDPAKELLAVAIDRGNSKTTERLIARGTKLDLLRACELGRTDDVRHLIESDSAFANAALELAVKGGHVEIVRLLIDRGIEPEPARQLAFHAAQQGSIEVLKLVTGNEPLTKTDKKGATLLHAASSGLQPDMIAYLLARGLDVNTRNFDRETPLNVLGESKMRWETINHNEIELATKTAKLLIDAGADVNAMDRFESTPLHQAAFFGFVNVVRQLLSKGADVNHVDDYGRTALEKVKSSARWERVPTSETRDAVQEVLIEFGAK